MEHLSLVWNLLIFGAAATGVWIAGASLAGFADAIAEKTGMAREFLGLILLGCVTSLPEMAVGATASLSGHPLLSVNDVLGSAAINVVIIAVADAALGREAITSVLASPGVLLQGVLGVVLLAMVIGATMTGDVPLLGAGVWTWLLLASCGMAIWIVSRSQSGQAWVAVRRLPESRRGPHEPEPMPRLLFKTGAAAAGVLGAGFLLAKVAETIATQSGLGASFVGASLLAVATSLPELSAVLAAVRLKRYEMAVAGVFGTNLFNVTIIFMVDLLYDGGPVLAEAGRFSGFAALLAIVLTALYLAGMIERRDRSFLRMGFDSLAALGAYAAGVAVLYQLR